MPNYDYRCTNEECSVHDSGFVLQTKVDERDEPCAVPCPACGGQIERYLSAPPGFGDPYRLGRVKTPDAFKDVLKNMKKKFRGNTIDSR